MPLSGTPAPNKRKKSTKIIMEISSSREGQPESSSLNLGKKISVPRDIMLEELSLLSNKGSKMFKLRQKRVEKFIYENNPDVFADNSVDHFQKFIPSVGGHMGVGGGVAGGGYGLIQGTGRFVSSLSGGQHGHGGQPPVPPPKPGSKGGAGGQQGAGGAGGAGGPGGQGGSGGVEGSGGKDGQSGQPGGQGGKQITIFKTYLSPWDKAMGVDPKQATPINVNLLEYYTKADLQKYKSFNRSAMPYGGYEKASKLMTFQMPEFDAGPEPEDVTVFNPTVTNRPSFNRTPIGWLGSGDNTNYAIELNVPADAETEEL